MPARTNVRLSVGKNIYQSCTTLSSQLGTFLWNMTVGYIRRFLATVVATSFYVLHALALYCP